jgi:DNA-binding CsgD family transcriptional regulator
VFEPAVELAPRIGSRYWIRFTSALAALAWVEQGHPARAESLLAGLVDLSRPAQTWGERTVWYVHARLAQAQGDPAAALQLTDRLIASELNASPQRPVRRLTYLRGELLMALGRTAEAEEALLAAHRVSIAHGSRPTLWRIEAALGRVYTEQRRRPEAEAAYAAAQRIVAELAADVPDLALRETFLRSASEQVPRSRPPTPRQEASKAFGRLTARESEVAILVGQGMSNREIADALVLGERTVQTHVGHILDKLGFSSRAQIAAWVARRAQSADR